MFRMLLNQKLKYENINNTFLKIIFLKFTFIKIELYKNCDRLLCKLYCKKLWSDWPHGYLTDFKIFNSGVSLLLNKNLRSYLYFKLYKYDMAMYPRGILTTSPEILISWFTLSCISNQWGTQDKFQGFKFIVGFEGGLGAEHSPPDARELSKFCINFSKNLPYFSLFFKKLKKTALNWGICLECFDKILKIFDQNSIEF